MSIIEKSFKSFIFNISGAALGFIFQILSAKYFGAEIYGQANYYLGYCYTINIFICFGLQTYLPKIITNVENKKELFSEVITTYTISFLIMQIPLFLILKNSNISIFNYFIIIILSYFISLSEIILSYNISMGNAAKGMFYRKFMYSTFNVFLFLIACIFTVKKYYIYIFIMIISYIFTCVPFLIKNMCKLKVNFKIIKYSLGFYIIQIVYGVYSAYSKVLQKQYGTFQTVAVLSVSMTIGTLVAMLGDNFAKVSMPEFSKAWSEKNFKNMKHVYMTVSRINCFLVLPIAIALIVNANKILNILGKGYIGGEIIFSLIMISQFTNSFTGPNGTILVMTKYTKFEIFNGVIKLMVSILVVLLLGNKLVWAVALSLALSEIVVNVLKCIEVKIKLGILPYETKDLFYILIIGAIETIILISISKIDNFILWILLNGIMIIIFHVMTFRLSPNKNDRDMIRNIKLSTIKMRIF